MEVEVLDFEHCLKEFSELWSPVQDVSFPSASISLCVKEDSEI